MSQHPEPADRPEIAYQIFYTGYAEPLLSLQHLRGRAFEAADMHWALQMVAGREMRPLAGWIAVCRGVDAQWRQVLLDAQGGFAGMAEFERPEFDPQKAREQANRAVWRAQRAA